MDLLLFFTLLAFTISYLIHTELYFRRLKNRLPDVFAKIGSPSVIGRQKSALPLIWFFVSGEFLQLSDVSLVNMGIRLVVHFFAVFIFFMGFFAFIALYVM